MARKQEVTPATPRKPPKEVAAQDVQKERVAVAAYRRSKKGDFDPARQPKEVADARREVAKKPEKDVPDIGNTMVPDRYGSEKP
jgi:hypothetical protein